jgi:hypothetical protein
MFKKIEGLAYLLFILSNFLILLNPGVYWDDWTLFNMNNEGIMSQFNGNGIWIFGYLHLGLKNISESPHLYHWLTFCLQFFTLFLLFRILRNVVRQSQYYLFLLISVLLFAVFPHYDAKITMIVFPYTLCLTLFVLGSYFLFHSEKNGNLLSRVLSLIFFFISFFTNSLLFFYLIPIFFALFSESINLKDPYKSFQNIYKIVITKLDFFLLPFLFWTIKSIYFLPSQQYAAIGYNQIDLSALFQVPYKMIVLMYIFIKDLYPFIKEAFEYYELWILFLLIFGFSYYQLSKIKINIQLSWGTVLFGVLLFLIGAFPYLLVNKYPTYIDYLSRHQLLVGFGGSLSLCSLIFLFKSTRLKQVLLSGILTTFVCLNVFVQFSYFKGYMKQEVFKDYFVSQNVNSNVPLTIILEDYTKDFTKKGNPVKFYAFAGMMKQVNQKENIVLVDQKSLDGYKKLGLFEMISPYLNQYNLRDYSYTEPGQKLIVKFTSKNLPTFPIMTFYYQFLNGNTYKWNEYFRFKLVDIS